MTNEGDSRVTNASHDPVPIESEEEDLEKWNAFLATMREEPTAGAGQHQGRRCRHATCPAQGCQITPRPRGRPVKEREGQGEEPKRRRGRPCEHEGCDPQELCRKRREGGGKNGRPLRPPGAPTDTEREREYRARKKREQMERNSKAEVVLRLVVPPRRVRESEISGEDRSWIAVPEKKRRREPYPEGPKQKRPRRNQPPGRPATNWRYAHERRAKVTDRGTPTGWWCRVEEARSWEWQPIPTPNVYGLTRGRSCKGEWRDYTGAEGVTNADEPIRGWRHYVGMYKAGRDKVERRREEGDQHSEEENGEGTEDSEVDSSDSSYVGSISEVHRARDVAAVRTLRAIAEQEERENQARSRSPDPASSNGNQAHEGSQEARNGSVETRYAEIRQIQRSHYFTERPLEDIEIVEPEPVRETAPFKTLEHDRMERFDARCRLRKIKETREEWYP